MNIEQRPTAKLKEYRNNPRKNDHAVDQMAEIIKKFGFRIPILIKSDGSIIDGHLRFKAALALGLQDVPCIVADGLTETEIKAFRLSVNKAAELADWNEDLLKLELLDLQDQLVDLADLGFADIQLQDSPKDRVLKKTDLAAPKMSWVLIGIPLVQFGEIQQYIDDISALPETIVQTTTTD